MDYQQFSLFSENIKVLILMLIPFFGSGGLDQLTIVHIGVGIGLCSYRGNLLSILHLGGGALYSVSENQMKAISPGQPSYSAPRPLKV
jgi:hypothetical protein